MTRRIVPHATTAQIGSTVLEVGEIVHDDTLDQLRVGDGVTAGGRLVADAAALAAALNELDTEKTAVSALSANGGGALVGTANGESLATRLLYAQITQNLSKITYYTANAVRVSVPENFVMSGFRFDGSYKKQRGRLMPSGTTAGFVAVNDSTHLAVESAIHASNWYAVFACCNAADASATYVNMPFFRAASVAGSVITLGQGGETDGDTVTTTTYAGLANDELLGREVLVIHEGREFSGRTTTVTANTDGTVTLASIGTVGPNDFFLVAPPGYTDYAYLGSCYRDTGEFRNMAGDGHNIGSLGSNVTGIPATGEIASSTRYSLAGVVSPLATGFVGQLTYTISTASTGTVAHYFSHDSAVPPHLLHTEYDDKQHTGSQTYYSQVRLQFSKEQATWLSTAGTRDTSVAGRSLQVLGWIEP